MLSEKRDMEAEDDKVQEQLLQEKKTTLEVQLRE